MCLRGLISAQETNVQQIADYLRFHRKEVIRKNIKKNIGLGYLGIIFISTNILKEKRNENKDNYTN